MSNYTYDKYKEILTRLEKSLEKLKKADEDTYYSYEAEDVARNLISVGNSLIMYIRHLERYELIKGNNMRNTLGDLNNHLFMQLEKLSEDDLKGEELREEIIRTKAIGEIAKHIIDNANVVLQAQKLKNNTIDIDSKMPKMLEG